MSKPQLSGRKAYNPTQRSASQNFCLPCLQHLVMQTEATLGVARVVSPTVEE